jgi:hypothetical protein
MSALVVLQHLLAPLCPELPPAFPVDFMSLIWDERVCDSTAGWGSSCKATSPSHGGRVSVAVGALQQLLPPWCPELATAYPPQFISLPPLGPGFTPAFPINFVSVFWGNGVGDFTTGSCNASSPSHGGRVSPGRCATTTTPTSVPRARNRVPHQRCITHLGRGCKRFNDWLGRFLQFYLS